MASDDISRLYDFAANTTISSDQVDAEINQVVTTCNGKAGRAVNNSFTGDNTFAGTDNFTGLPSFSNASGLKTDTITERSSGVGVTIDSVLLKDGFIQVPAGAGYTPAANGEIGYDSTSHTYDVYVNGAAQFLLHDGHTATQSDQETGTATNRFVTSGRQHYHPSAAKAWAAVTMSGTPAFDASYGFTSITDTATGNQTYNFTTAMSSANYCAVSNCTAPTAGNNFRLAQPGTRGTGGIQIFTGVTNTDANLVLADLDDCYVAVFGDV